MSPNTTPIRLIAADDHPLIRQGFQHIFSRQTDILLLAVVSNGKELLEAVKQEQPDVVILDLKMPVMDGPEAARLLQLNFPSIRVLAYSMHEEEHLFIQLQKFGVRGYLLKGSDGDEVCRAVRAIHAGGEYYCPAIRKRIQHLFLHGKLGQAVTDHKQNYAPQELEIIKLICQERSCKEIADTLKISKRNVEYYKERIQEKMGVKGSVGIAVYTITNWLLY